MLSAPQKLNLRRYPRRRIAWPVTVEVDKRLLHGETLDVSPKGAKLRLKERLEVGTRATLHLTPTQGQPMAIEAILWRLDGDGLVFFFLKATPTVLEPQQ